MEQPVDPVLIPLACILAECEPDHLLRATWSGGALNVQAINKPAYIFTAESIAAAVAGGDIALGLACGLHQRPAPDWYQKHVEPALLAAPAPPPAPDGRARAIEREAARSPADRLNPPTPREQYTNDDDMAPAERSAHKPTVLAETIDQKAHQSRRTVMPDEREPEPASKADVDTVLDLATPPPPKMGTRHKGKRT